MIKSDETSKSNSKITGGSNKRAAGNASDFFKKHGISKDKSIDENFKSVDRGVGKVSNRLANNTIDSRSIVARSKNSVIQFPIYATESIPVAEAHTISKVFERVYASFVQTVLSQNPVIENVNDINNLKFLKQYHTNIKDVQGPNNVKDVLLSMFNEYYTPIDNFDQLMTEGVYFEAPVGEIGKVIFEVTHPNMHINKACARMSNEPLHGLRYLHESTADDIGNAATVKRRSNPQVYENVTDAQVNKIIDQNIINKWVADEKSKGHDPSNDEIKAKRNAEIEKFKNNEISSIVTNPASAAKDPKSKQELSWNSDLKKFVISRRRESEITPAKLTNTPELLRDSDVRKINGMLPYTIKATFQIYNKDAVGRSTGDFKEIAFLIGVKTIMHRINVKDLSDDLREIITGKQRNLQKVRYKTGEISFWKDYVLNMKNLKKDASKSITGKRWLNTLKRLGEYEELHGTALKGAAKVITGGNIPIPNGTLVLSSGDISRLKDETGINLEEVNHAKSLAKNLFLISVVIIDAIAGSMKVLFVDSDNDWDYQSLAAIDADVAKQDNSPLLAELRKLSRK